jgi:hypothetical protein
MWCTIYTSAEGGVAALRAAEAAWRQHLDGTAAPFPGPFDGTTAAAAAQDAQEEAQAAEEAVEDDDVILLGGGGGPIVAGRPEPMLTYVVVDVLPRGGCMEVQPVPFLAATGAADSDSDSDSGEFPWRR